MTDIGQIVIIGAQRSGTTLLLHLLGAHPSIDVARPVRPEPKWFLGPMEGGLEGYLAKHYGARRAAVWRLEKSTSYIDHPEVAERIAAVVPNARLIAVVRDPVARAVSNYRFSVHNGVETRPIEKALSVEQRGRREFDRDRFSSSPYAYLERGCYMSSLEPFVGRFGDHLRVILFDDLVAGTAHRQLLDWFGLDSSEVIDARPAVVNGSVADAEDLTPKHLEELRSFFEEPDRELARHLGHELPWRTRSTQSVGERHG